MAKDGIAPDLGSGGRRFESGLFHQRNFRKARKEGAPQKMIFMAKGFLQEFIPEHLACEDVRFNPTGRNPKRLHSILIPWYTAGFQ